MNATKFYNALGPVCHVAAGLIGFFWFVALGYIEPELPLAAACIIASLLPDIDSGSSHIGRIANRFGNGAADWLENQFGHRTITHSWAALLGFGLFSWLWFPEPDSWLISAAFMSHLIVDIVVGDRGIQFLYPNEMHFYTNIFSVKPRSFGEAVLTLLLIAASFFPFVRLADARTISSAFGGDTAAFNFSPTATPDLLLIRIARIAEPETQILVAAGDRIERGTLLADRSMKLDAPASATATATVAPMATPRVITVEFEDMSVSGPAHLVATLVPDATRQAAHLRWRIAQAEYDSVMKSDVEISDKLQAELRLEQARLAWNEARKFPQETSTPTATPTATPDSNKVFAVVAGLVMDVRVESVQENEATIVIAILAEGRLGGHGHAATVVRVIDGDTVVLSIDGKTETVRLIGIDTPETQHPQRGIECYGPEASDFTKSQLQRGATVQLETDAESRDKYGRLLGYVWHGGEMLNKKILSLGYAKTLSIEPNTKYAAEFSAVEAEAQGARIGLWGACD